MIPVIDDPAILALYAAPVSAAEDQQAAVTYARAPVGSGYRACGRTEVRAITEQVVRPVALPVALAAAISKAKADGADMEAEIEAEVRGIAGQVQHELRRALVEQTWRVTLDAFPEAITLAMPPLIAMEHVKFFDVDGAQQTLDPQDYLVDPVGPSPRALPVPGRRWPDVADRPGAVEVQYRCGYGADHTAVPPEIQSYILARIEQAHLPAGISKSAQYLDGLLDPYRIYG